MMIKKLFKIIVLALVSIGIFPAGSFASEVAARVEWQYRDNVFGAHPSAMEQLANGNILMVINGYTNPRVVEVSRQGQLLWSFLGIQANSAVRLANGNTLIADSGAPGKPFVPRVIEVALEGQVVWQYALPSRAQAPRYATALTNGSFLVATKDKVFEVNEKGQLGFSYTDNTLLNISSAKELANGNIIIVDQGLRGRGQIVEITKAGKVVQRIIGLTRPTDALRQQGGSTLVLDLGTFMVIE
ncbi:MAG: hypothetical protein SCK28_01945, partial [Bacillota bacterium]|nr:hypothetical protein [Bacillota bacterium]